MSMGKPLGTVKGGRVGVNFILRRNDVRSIYMGIDNFFDNCRSSYLYIAWGPGLVSDMVNLGNDNGNIGETLCT